MAFEFEHKYRFHEKRYTEFNRIFSRKYRWVRLTAVLFSGIVFLFWKYTLVIGVILIVLFAFGLLVPSITGFGARHTYRRTPFLRELLTYGISDRALWLIGPDLEVRVGWSSVHVWDERDGWLRLSPYGAPALWFPIRKLKDAGVYDQIMELCARHAVRFNSPEARGKRPVQT